MIKICEAQSYTKACQKDPRSSKYGWRLISSGRDQVAHQPARTAIPAPPGFHLRRDDSDALRAAVGGPLEPLNGDPSICASTSVLTCHDTWMAARNMRPVWGPHVQLPAIQQLRPLLRDHPRAFRFPLSTPSHRNTNVQKYAQQPRHVLWLNLAKQAPQLWQHGPAGEKSDARSPPRHGRAISQLSSPHQPSVTVIRKSIRLCCQDLNFCSCASKAAA